MLASKKKQLAVVTLTAGFLLLLLVLSMPTGPVPEALQISVLGSTNGPLGSPMTLLNVTNHTGQARFFFVVAEVPTSNGWTTARGQQPLWQRLAAHSECRVPLRAPEGAARWNFRCTSLPEVSKPESLWYLFVRRTGLGRVGLRSKPSESYVWTSEMSL